ncbi:MAG: PIG-L family deacetylase [Myxococcales bacterium]|nr:PIG-L family deacetylase [Myxococcales bacterium]
MNAHRVWAQGLRLRLGLEGTRTPVDSLDLASLRRALVVVAHTDDEINTVGLLSRLRAAGVVVDLLVLTDGAANPWTDAKVVGARSHFECRRDELQAAMKELSIADAVLPALPDGKLGAHLDEATAIVRNELERRAPGLVITFDPRGINGHPDHVAANVAVRRALASVGVHQSPNTPALAMITPPPPFSWALGTGFRSVTPPTIATLTLTAEERERKARVFDGYRSQWKTLRLLTGGLPPRVFFTLFPAEWFVWLSADAAREWVRA